MRMKNNTKNSILCWTAVILFFAMSVSFGFMPLDFPGKQWWRFVPGGIFWGCAASGLILVLILIRRYKNYPKKKRPAIITFFSNPIAVVSDIALFAGIAALILLVLIRGAANIWCFSAIGLSTFALCMHCIFNSRISTCIIPDRKTENIQNNNSEKNIKKSKNIKTQKALERGRKNEK